jgi:hypothetical protein
MPVWKAHTRLEQLTCRKYMVLSTKLHAQRYAGGAAGFKPPNDGVRVLCLSAWLCPSTKANCRLIGGRGTSPQ